MSGRLASETGMKRRDRLKRGGESGERQRQGEMERNRDLETGGEERQTGGGGGTETETERGGAGRQEEIGTEIPAW